ncbi:unnamed protein product [Coccothraustes coccothraustes]
MMEAAEGAPQHNFSVRLRIDGSSVALGRSLHPNFSGFVAVLQDPGAIGITLIPLIESRIPNVESSREIFLSVKRRHRRSVGRRSPGSAGAARSCGRSEADAGGASLPWNKSSAPSQAIFPALPSAGGDQGLLCGLPGWSPWRFLGSFSSKSPPSS